MNILKEKIQMFGSKKLSSSPETISPVFSIRAYKSFFPVSENTFKRKQRHWLITADQVFPFLTTRRLDQCTFTTKISREYGKKNNVRSGKIFFIIECNNSWKHFPGKKVTHLTNGGTMKIFLDAFYEKCRNPMLQSKPQYHNK